MKRKTIPKKPLKGASNLKISYISSTVLILILIIYNLVNYYFLDPSCGIKVQVLCPDITSYFISLDFLILLFFFSLFFLIHLISIFIFHDIIHKKELSQKNGVIIILSFMLFTIVIIELLRVMIYEELVVLIIIFIAILLLFLYKRWSFKGFTSVLFISWLIFFFLTGLIGFIVVIVLFILLNIAYILLLGLVVRMKRYYVN